VAHGDCSKSGWQRLVTCLAMRAERRPGSGFLYISWQVERRLNAGLQVESRGWGEGLYR
jgi:hypothetical protein